MDVTGQDRCVEGLDLGDDTLDGIEHVDRKAPRNIRTCHVSRSNSRLTRGSSAATTIAC